jgi:hypothetical protein
MGEESVPADTRRVSLLEPQAELSDQPQEIVIAPIPEDNSLPPFVEANI